MPNRAKSSAPPPARAKRAVSSATQPAAAPRTLRVPITNAFDGNDYSARILIGSQKVPANVILDTGSSTLAVAASVYDATRDSAMTPTTLAQQVSYGTGAWLGPVVNTTLGLGDAAGDNLTLPNAPMAIATVQAQNTFTGVDGIMGLAYLSLNSAHDLKKYLVKSRVHPPVTFPWPFNAGNFKQAWGSFSQLLKTPDVTPTSIPPYFSLLETQGLTLNKFAFYTLRSWVRLASSDRTAIARDPWNNGVLVLGGGEEQTDLYTGDFENVDVIHDLYYNVNLISVQVAGCDAVPAAPLQAQYAGAGSNAIVDSGTNPLVLSNDVYTALLDSLGKLNPKFVQLIQQSQPNGIDSSLLGLDAWPAISFTLTGDAGQPVTLTCSPQTYWQEDYPSAGKAVFQICAADNGNPVNQSILGLPLMNNYYTVFDRSLGAGNGIIRFAPLKAPQP